MAPRTHKPPLTGVTQKLPFDSLSPADFERLCLWLVKREGYSLVEHPGEAGNEQGRDLVAWKDGKRVVFQCKRVKSFSAADAQAEIRKLHDLAPEEQPHVLVFVVSQAVSAATSKAARKAWGDETSCQFWSGSDLDERVKRYPAILREFFQLPPDWVRASFPHNLPYTSLGSLFQGRDEILIQLRETLERSPTGRATAIAGKAVHGLGGVGKTRLAIEFAWKYAEEYSALLFVGAESPADLRRNLAALSEGKILDLPEQQVTEEEIRELAVLKWLQEHSGWLLILDNIDSEEAAEAVDRFVPLLHGGHVLLTGRIARWSAEVEAIELDVLTEEAAVRFLLSRTENRRRKTKEDDAHASTLARELGCLPLALEQAAAYIAERRLTLAGYLEEWQSRRDQVLAWFDPRVSHYHASIAVTWQTSFDRLSASAKRLLERLAWLGPEPIPESLLDVPVPDRAEPGSDPRDALAQLEAYSLVTRAKEAPSFTIHRLVQDVTRRSLGHQLGQETLIEALRWVNAAFTGEPQDVHTWPTLDALAPHARAVVTFADAAGIADPTARLMNQLGQLFDAKALLIEAEPLMERVVTIIESGYGEKHPNFSAALNNLAQLLQATNRLAEAEPLMRRALDIDEQSFGATHPDVATALNNLAQLLQATNRLAEAEPMMERVVSIFESSLGDQHPNVATALNNLAQLLQATNRLAEAEPLMRRALDIDEQSFGATHPNVATRLNNLALLLQNTNRLAEAEPLMRRALDIFLEFERRTGYEHPRRAVASKNYEGMIRELGKSDAEIEAAMGLLKQEAGFAH